MTYNVHNVRESLFDAHNTQFMIVLPFDVNIHIVVLTYNVHNIRRPLFDAQYTIHDCVTLWRKYTHCNIDVHHAQPKDGHDLTHRIHNIWLSPFDVNIHIYDIHSVRFQLFNAHHS